MNAENIILIGAMEDNFNAISELTNTATLTEAGCFSREIIIQLIQSLVLLINI